MITFLEKVYELMASTNHHDWSKTLVLFPNNRSAYYFKEQLKNKLQVGQIFPTLQTLESLIAQSSVYEKADSFELIFVLYDIYKKYYPETSLQHFLPVAKTMLTDFGEIDAELCPPKGFFRDLQALKSMNVFMEEDEGKAYKYKYFWQAFEDCYNSLQAYCAIHQRGYSGMQFRDVAERGLDMQTNVEYVFCVGFTQLSKSELKIVGDLQSRYKGEYIVDVDAWYYNDASHTAGISYRKVLNELRIRYPKFIEENISTQPKVVHVYPCNGKTQQVKTCFSILEQQQIVDEERNKTALILPDSTLIHPLLAALPEQYADANISMGYPMRNALIIRFIKQLQLLLDYKKVFNGVYHYHIRFLAQLFEFPFLQHGMEELHALQRYKNLVYVSESQLKRMFAEEKVFCELLLHPDSPQEVAKLLETFLQQITTSGLDKNEMLFLQETKLLQKEVNAIGERYATLLVEDYFLLLIDALQTHSLPFDVDPNKGLQIMGIMESRNLDYEQVFLFSLNEGVFPANSSGNSYIPFELRINYLTPPIEKDAISTYLFYRLFHRSNTLHLFYNTNQDAFAGGEPSRFLLQLQMQLAGLPNIEVITHEVVSTIGIDTDNSIISVEKSPEIMERLKYTLTHKGLSPSGLNIYNNCSLQFYYKYVLGVKAADDLGESIESDLLGSAVHFALEQLYAPHVGMPITVDVVKAMKDKDKIEAYVKQHIEEGFDTKLLAGKNYLLYRVSVKLVMLFLDNEIAFLSEGHSMFIYALESDLNGTLEARGEQVKFKGIADRIDEVDGLFRIADYKTGKKSALTISEINAIQLSDPKNAKQFQLLMYAWMFAKDKSDVKGLISGIYWLRNRSVDYYNPLVVVKESVLDRQLIVDFESCLTEMIDNMLNEEIPFTMTEDEARCKFCDYKNSCKRQ